MPGIIGCNQKSDKSVIDGMLQNLYTTKFVKTQRLKGNCNLDVAVLSINQTPFVLTKGDITIAFDGYIVNFDLQGDKLLHRLIDEYLKTGEMFVRKLRGSFQLLLYHKGVENNTMFLYSDHTASRQIFYIQKDTTIYFAPEVAPLINLLPEKDLNTNALIHFLICGYFPSGNTLIKQIKKLFPGEYLVIKNGKIEKKRYFRYKIESNKNFNPDLAINELNILLVEKIYQYWDHAFNPAILLSGGTDSQYIFYAIAEYVSDTSKLTTVSWGQNKKLKDSDMKIAYDISKKFGTKHIVLRKNILNFKDEFIDMFDAQSGMTDSSFYHANELNVIKQLREQYKIFSLFRGDECFGFKQQVETFNNALISIDMAFPENINDIENWFKNKSNVFEKYRGFIKDLVYNYNLNPNEVKDTLYVNERLTMALHPLNYFKYHYQHVYNPLIDADILTFVKTVPNNYRDDKLLFRKCLEKKFYNKFRYSIAKKTNLIQWGDKIALSKKLQNYFKDELKLLPHIFNENYFQSCLNSFSNKRVIIKKKIKMLYLKFAPHFIGYKIFTFKARMNRNIKQNKNVSIEPYFYLFRIVTLSRWFKKCNFKND
jgi:asparagine synthetase B (glutamine-hydrolysing)